MLRDQPRYSLSHRLPMLGREGDRGAAEGVVEPGVLGVGGGEEAFEAERGGDARHKGACAVEEREEAVPIDGEEERVVGGEEGSAGGKRDGAQVEAGEGQGGDGIGVQELGDEDEFLHSGGYEDAEKVRQQKRLEAAFGGHPDGLGFEEALELVAAGRVGKMIVERADRGEQRLVDARTGVEAGRGRDFHPRDLGAARHDLGVARILMRGAPGQLRRHAHKGMQRDKDALERAAIGFEQRFAVSRISKLFRLH